MNSTKIIVIKIRACCVECDLAAKSNEYTFNSEFNCCIYNIKKQNDIFSAAQNKPQALQVLI